MRNIFEKSRVVFVHKNPGYGLGRKNPRTRAQRGFSRRTQLKERGLPLLVPVSYVFNIRVTTMKRLCRRPFRPMTDYALAWAAAKAKLTAELHAQARKTCVPPISYLNLDYINTNLSPDRDISSIVSSQR